MSKGGAFRALARLADWFERQKRVLPWRDNPSVYRVWISEIMLQQTQVAAVKPYFERFLARFPSVNALAAAPEGEVLRLWAGLGYYSRARNLHRAAQVIVARGGFSQFPRTRAEWLELPGVGEYTAGAVLSIAYDAPEPILDANVERVLARVHRAGARAKLWGLAREWVEAGVRARVRPSVLNQALMELGATVCTAREARCGICPLAAHCGAKAKGRIGAFPPSRKRKQWVEVREELHVHLDRKGRVLLRRRCKGEWRAGLWDALETPPPEGAKLLGEIVSKHVVTRHRVTRVARIWVVSRSRPAREGHAWVSLKRPEEAVAVGSALRKTLKAVRERFWESFPP